MEVGTGSDTEEEGRRKKKLVIKAEKRGR